MSGNPHVNGFVLAGGRSQRMGCDKASLKLNGQPLLLRAVNLLKAHLGSVAVLGPRGRYESLGVPVLPDRWPGQGPLGALLTGLESSANGWNIFLACDLPLLNGQFIELLLRSTLAVKLDAVVPRTNEGWHPLCAAYRLTRSKLLKELDLAQGIAEKKTTIPILSNILLEASDAELRISATDLELGLKCGCQASVQPPGASAVPGKRRTCSAKMRRALENGKSAVIDILPHLRVDVITSDRLAGAGIADGIFENVNSPEDWQRVLARLRVDP